MYRRADGAAFSTAAVPWRAIASDSAKERLYIHILMHTAQRYRAFLAFTFPQNKDKYD